METWTEVQMKFKGLIKHDHKIVTALVEGTLESAKEIGYMFILEVRNGGCFSQVVFDCRDDSYEVNQAGRTCMSMSSVSLITSRVLRNSVKDLIKGLIHSRECQMFCYRKQIGRPRIRDVYALYRVRIFLEGSIPSKIAKEIVTSPLSYRQHSLFDCSFAFHTASGVGVYFYEPLGEAYAKFNGGINEFTISKLEHPSTWAFLLECSGSEEMNQSVS